MWIVRCLSLSWWSAKSVNWNLSPGCPFHPSIYRKQPVIPMLWWFLRIESSPHKGLTHQYWTTYILRMLSNATWNMSDLPSMGNRINTSVEPSIRAILHSISNFQMKIANVFHATPWKINMEPTNHPFRKEHDLPNLHDNGPFKSSRV